MSILTVERAKTLISNNSIGSDRYEDADIQADIDVAEAQVAEKVGPLELTEVTVTVWAGAIGATLPGQFTGPVTAVSNWPGDLTTLTVSDGVLSGLPSGRFAVTFTGGWTVPPAPVVKAIEEQFKHVWSMRRGNSNNRGAPNEPGSAHAMPYRVSELLAPYSTGPRP